MSSSPHPAPDPGPAELVEVADRVVACVQPDGSWWIDNTGFVVGRKSVVSIEQRLLYCGDLLFNGGTPFLLMGSVTGVVRVLTEVLAPIPAETIVPGHGQPCTPALIDTVVGYLRFALDLARETDLGDYAGWLDVFAALGDMVADNDGRPLSCYA